MRTAPEDPRVVPAKVRMPTPRTDVVRRPRLLDRLERDGVRVVLVSAPAGWGKSVLVLDWLRRSERPVAWLSLGPLDDDPGRFLAHLSAAVATLPSCDAAAAALARLSRGGDLESDTTALTALAGCPEDAVLVLDDVQHLESPALTGFLDRLVNELGGGPRLVLLTRVDPPVALGRLRLSGELVEIRERDLRFDPEETAVLLGRLLPFEVPPELAERLGRRTEGWAAGLRLAAAAVALAGDDPAAADDFTGRHELLVDYLVEEVVSRQDPALRRFLMDTSVLPRFTAAGCAEVTGDPEAAEHLRAVADANLFLVTLDEGEGWYRYHHLFAELLEYRLRRQDPDRIDTLRLRASRWFERVGDLQEALSQAARMTSADRLVELLDRHGYPILARSEFGAFARWLARVPDPLDRGMPMFQAAVAWFHVQSDRAPDLPGLLGALEAAVEAPPEGYPSARVDEARLHLHALRAFTLRIADRLDEALAASDDILARLPEDAVSVRAVVEFNRGAVCLRLADVPRARESLEAAYELSLRADVPYLVLACLGHLGALAAQDEGVDAARQRLEAAVAFAEERGLDGVPAFGIVLYQLGAVLCLGDRLDEARELLDAAARLTRDERETDIHANVLIHRARVSAWQGDFDAAEEALTVATSLAHGHNVKPFATTFAVERAQLAELRDGRFLPPGDGSDGAERGEGWSSVREAETVLALRHAVALGRRDEADILARRLLEESRRRRRGVAACAALLGAAAVADDAGERRERTVEALELAARHGYVRPLLDGGAPVRALLEVALAGPLPAPVRDFARERVLPRLPSETGPAVAGVPAGSAGPELTDRELEVLGLLATGRTNAEIARRLFVSVNTVKTHLKRVYAELGVSTRTEAVERSRRLGLPLPDPDRG